ncbi:aldehyde dehydrogenase family protein [Noviherbaspirillum sedimenti]|uniref:Aldehyde dehydrogenase family protein n=1 Tax=Noviherbaspirillum sedimenti TaxID=2320865 RepID=A0A3A3G4H3_9BURK|nr:aldehyde dehydrogenase family protein [Noviherbaspirillum sedimenti]RJG03378.1 aldehyde dehydrogenase family protein [Noviherbaspirillum sedimenti]
MGNTEKFYIDGLWSEPQGQQRRAVINPATEEAFAHIRMGSAEDVDRAVMAARRAFESYSQSTRELRMSLLARIIEVYQRRMAELGRVISDEMGAPLPMAIQMQAGSGMGHLKANLEILRDYQFEQVHGRSVVAREPVGVCALITPWNWPVNQMVSKIVPALAAGCTMVLKPSELSPLSAVLLAEILDEAGVPPGVFNLVQGDGPTVGATLAAHPEVDMVSFTGSTRGGVAVAKAAADTVKRVTQELGGKSANIILADADFAEAVRAGTVACLINSGQTCKAPTRMLVPAARHAEAVQLAREVAEAYRVGDPLAEGTQMGPLANRMQYDRVREMIAVGVAEGAELVCGGAGLPEGVEGGYFVRPTVFANVNNAMRIAREEIFGPVLCILPFESEDQAVAIANDTPYGLSGAVWADSFAQAVQVGRRLRTGSVHLNGAPSDLLAPFGGYKQSGNGREWGVQGLEEFLETKALIGSAAHS